MEIVKTCVSRCLATECSYNFDEKCHALGINVGDEHQKCDTYLLKSKRAGNIEANCLVGSCKVYTCAYNVDYLCAAEDINVGKHKGHADCLNFTESGL